MPIWVKMKRMAEQAEEGSIQSQEGAGLLQRRTPGLKVSIVGERVGDKRPELSSGVAQVPRWKFPYESAAVPPRVRYFP